MDVGTIVSGEVKRPNEVSNQRATKIQPEAGFLALAGEFVVRAKGGRSTAQFAEGLVHRRGLDCPAGIGEKRGAAEVVGEEVF